MTGADTDRWSAAPSKIHKIRHFYSPAGATSGATMPPVVPRCHQAAPGARAQHLTARDVHLGLEHHGTWSSLAGDVFYCEEDKLFQQCDGTLNCEKSRLYVQEEECFVTSFSQAIKTIVVD